ncbi:MAG: YgiT-type zinc finger protein [Nitrososphaerota archaeon]
MRCENCGELLKESKLQTLIKTEKDRNNTSRTISWICDNCGQKLSKIVDDLQIPSKF